MLINDVAERPVQKLEHACDFASAIEFYRRVLEADNSPSAKATATHFACAIQPPNSNTAIA